MSIDPSIYYAAIPAVLLVGFAKGGMGEALSLMGVPLMSLAVPPVEAAALLLPILIAMDIVSLWMWRHHGDGRTLRMLLPGGLIGIAIGWATSAYVQRDALKLIIGLLVVLFVLRYVWHSWRTRRGTFVAPKPQRAGAAAVLGTFSGYGSFVAHAGGPPFQIYVMPQKLKPAVFVGTGAIFFAMINLIVVVPYIALASRALQRLNRIAAGILAGTAAYIATRAA